MPTTTKPSISSDDYFTCTLGEAAGSSLDGRGIHTINDFIDHQARKYPNENVLAFPVPTSSEWMFEIFTFEDLRKGSLMVSKLALPLVPQNKERSSETCVALLCPSSIDFLFAWLGFMRAGLSVLLIAPQCQPTAIAHLCKSCNVSVLFHDMSFADLSSQAVAEDPSGFQALQLPWQAQNTSTSSLIRSYSGSPADFGPSEQVKSSDTAFIFHTSGTSTGLPKPIIQSHHAAIGVLPILDGRQSATFTTTPLYHGGIADCLRAWTSRAMVWLFPASKVPITADHIRQCLLVAERASSEISVAKVKLFSSVPYVLQMLSEDSAGLEILQKMSIVGVGGAVLSPKVGDYLVENGVNLISRFGSAECGFLLSSNRDHAMDKDWQYLRLSPRSNCLVFEQQEGSALSELIVKKGWPHMAKTNRHDGFATGDLFEPHQTIHGAWKYYSRSDGQITLVTGKKFDPAPLEDFINSSSSLIRDVMVFGSNRQSPGIIVLPSEEGLELKELESKKEIWKTIDTINSKGDSHTRIPQEKIVIIYTDKATFQKSSKGTLLRGVNEKAFADEINSVYAQDLLLSSELAQISIDDEDIRDFVKGVSLRKGDGPLPWNVVYDCGNIDSLSNFIVKLRNGKLGPSKSEETEMHQLVDKFSVLNPRNPDAEKRPIAAPYVVILTGATGALGAHILDLLRKDPLITQIICLVRAVDHFTARSRVSASLLKRKKSSLEISDPKVWCSPYKLNQADIGISDMELSHIRQNATHIIHQAAWAVNFSLPLRSFVEEHVAGIHNLLSLTLSCEKAVQFNFCSSTASVLETDEVIIPEKISPKPLDAGSIGYSRSKWVAEAICAAAAKHLPGKVKILRLGQLTGDTKNGIWNISEAWPLMLSTVDALACLPRIEAPLSWLPLDTAATAVIELSLTNGPSERQPYVYHIVNNSTETSWLGLLTWSREIRPTPFEVVPVMAWLDKLESSPKKLPAKNLLGLWRGAYGKDTKDKQSTFSVENAQKETRAMRNVSPVDQALVTKIWSWLDEEIETAKEH
ncbi:Nonribosomal peptide synthase, partial [Hyphodiscus hymeniophilus]